MNAKSLKLKPFIFGIMPIFLLYFLITAILYFDHRNKINNFENEAVFDLNNEVKLILNGYKNFSDFIYNNSINSPEVTGLVYESYIKPETKDQNRKELQEKLQPLFSEIKKSSYRQLHFHLPDTESFLRMHRPEKYGDKLSGIRETVEYTNLNQIFSTGFEEGRIFNGYRFVYPLFSKGNHAGSVEISISYEAIIQSLEELFNKQYIFILKKEVVDKKVFKSEQTNYSSFAFNSSYLTDNLVNQPDFNKIYKEYYSDNNKKSEILNKQLAAEKNFIHPVFGKDVNSLFCAVILPNFKGINVGYLISIEDPHKYQHIKNDFRTTAVLNTVIFLLIILLVEHFIWVNMKFKEMAMHDKLTSLYNRHMFLEMYKQTCSRMKRFKVNSVIILADIDYFKIINDKYGHNTGDRVLKGFAKTLKSAIRESDVPARWGGEEFIVLLPRTSLEDGKVIAEKIRKAIEESDFGIKEKITCSFGVAEIIDHESDISLTIDRADKMLYISKNTGRNRVAG